MRRETSAAKTARPHRLRRAAHRAEDAAHADGPVGGNQTA